MSSELRENDLVIMMVPAKRRWYEILLRRPQRMERREYRIVALSKSPEA